jgi:hypothetical protein
MDFESEKEIFEFLLEYGYIQVATVDKHGELVYKMTPKMIEDFPEVFEEHMELTNNLVFSVWQKGLIEMSLDEEKGWNILPTEVTRKYEDFEDDLTDEEMLLMWEINQMMDDEV